MVTAIALVLPGKIYICCARRNRCAPVVVEDFGGLSGTNRALRLVPARGGRLLLLPVASGTEPLFVHLEILLERSGLEMTFQIRS